MSRKIQVLLLCALCLTMALAGNAMGVAKVYSPAISHINFGEDGMTEVYDMGFGNVTERALVGSYAGPGKMQVVAAAGHAIDQTNTMTVAGAVHSRALIEDASGGFAMGILQTNEIVRFQSDGTFLNSWVASAAVTELAEDDGGNIWAALGGVTSMSLVQYDPCGNVLQTVTSTGLPYRSTIDFVGGMEMYDGLMYVLEAGRMFKFDPCDPAGTMAEAIAATGAGWGGGGNFWEAYGMDIGSDGRIYVLENVNKSVMIYDATQPAGSNYIQTLTDPLLAGTMKGVGVDSAGTVYVGQSPANVLKFAVVPEPTTMILLGLGSVAMLRRKRR